MGICDYNGDEVVPCKYTYALQITGTDYFKIAIEGAWPSDFNKSISDNFWNCPPEKALWGIADKTGKVVVPCEYDYIQAISGDIAIVSKGGGVELYKDGKFYQSKIIIGKNGFYNLNNGKHTDCVYKGWRVVKEGMVPCLNKDDKWGYLDAQEFSVVIPFEYDKASSFEEGVAQVEKDGVASFITDPKKGTSLHLANGGGTASKIDSNIPQSGEKQDDSFAFIIANENYLHLKGADYAINDGKTFREYCLKTFGLLEKNVRYYEDATYGNIVNAVQKIKDIADVYEGDAKIIVYFSGLGMTDTETKESYLLPTDATIDALNVTGYKLQQLMEVLNGLKTRQTIIIIDAPFGGTDKEGKMLAQHRGVALKPKPVTPQNNTVLCLGSSGEEPAYASKDCGHGLFTYALLEKIQESKGKCTLKEAMDYATSNVRKATIKGSGKAQSPIFVTTQSTNIDNLKF